MPPPKVLFHETTHWVARGMAVVLLVFTLAVLYGNGLPNPAHITRMEMMLFISFFAMMLGAGLGLRFERLGGWMLLFAFSFFWLINAVVTRSFPLGVIFLMYGIVGGLYLLSWWSGPHPAHRARRAH